MSDAPTLDPSAVLWNREESDRAGTPLLVLLHGLGSNERDLFGLAPLLPAELTIASVRAPLPWPPGHAWFALDAAPTLPERVVAATAGAEAFIEWLRPLRAAHPWIGLLGFSQGAMTSGLVVRREPDLVDAAVLLSGGMFPREEAGDARLGETPVFLGWGDADPVIPPEMFAHTEEMLAPHEHSEAHRYRGLGHSVAQEEMDDVAAFLRGAMPA